MGRVRLLICDDAVMYATMLKAQLRDDPAIEVVGTAAEREEAVACARELRPDVVLLDHLLGHDDSSLLVPVLRREAPSAAVVLTSGSSEDRIAEAARASGADGWISKVASAEELRAEVLRAADGSA